MRILEIIFIALWGIGFIFRFNHWPGSSLIILVSSQLLAILYLFFSWLIFKDKATGKQNLAISLIAGFFLALGINGIMYKVQSYPGSSILLMASTAGLIFILLLAFVLRSQKSELKNYFNKILLRVGIVCVVGVYLYFQPNYYVNYYLKHHEVYRELLETYQDSIDITD